MEIKNELSGHWGEFKGREGLRHIGEVSYYMDEQQSYMTITHVGVDPKYRGGGKARELVMAAVEYARQNKMKIKPVCAYSRALFSREKDNLADVLYMG